MGAQKSDVEQLRYWRENNDRKSREVLDIWLNGLWLKVNSLGNEKFLVLEQVCLAALDCHIPNVAETCIESLSQSFPSSLRVRKLHAMYFEAKEDFGTATDILNSIIKADETNSAARKRKVAVLKAQGRTVDAIKELTDYLKIFMADVEAWQELAELYISEQDFSKAAFCVEELILHNPHNHLLHQRYADIKYTIGGLENLETARSYYSQALKINPKNMRALYGLYLTSSALSTSAKCSSQRKKEAAKLVEWSLKEIKKHMAWTRFQVFLALLMVFTGSINTISTKWADTIKSVGRDGELKNFDHPFFQASTMFLGELMCLVLFKTLYIIYSRRADGTEDVSELTKGNRNFNPLILYIPAICDMTATSIMYIGLNLTFASSFQMFRGSVIVFVGLLSVAFLNRNLERREWSGIGFVIIGLAVVGVADFVSQNGEQQHNKNDVITGDMLIVIAQIIQAVQMVVEEKFVRGENIPSLQAVGWEGLFGFVTLALLQIPFYFIHAVPPLTQRSGDRLEDAIDALVQMGNSIPLFFAILGTIISIAFFNFAGISVTKEMSATTRMVLDSVRTIVIWVFSLAFFGQAFHWLQLFGFVLLITGMCLYNGITFTSTYGYLNAVFARRSRRDNLEESIINTNAEETEP
ncbi:hypothetical protein YQE_11472, partial [Dendroctonus ponderosae]